MEFTTPETYGPTTVTVGGIVTDDSIVTAGGQTAVKHTESVIDPETEWAAPTAVRAKWTIIGPDNEGAQTGDKSGDAPIDAVTVGAANSSKDDRFEVLVEGPVGNFKSRIDVFDELPGFAKQIIEKVLSTKPYVYQVSCGVYLPFSRPSIG